MLLLSRSLLLCQGMPSTSWASRDKTALWWVFHIRQTYFPNTSWSTEGVDGEKAKVKNSTIITVAAVRVSCVSFLSPILCILVLDIYIIRIAHNIVIRIRFWRFTKMTTFIGIDSVIRRHIYEHLYPTPYSLALETGPYILTPCIWGVTKRKPNRTLKLFYFCRESYLI